MFETTRILPTTASHPLRQSPVSAHWLPPRIMGGPITCSWDRVGAEGVGETPYRKAAAFLVTLENLKAQG